MCENGAENMKDVEMRESSKDMIVLWEVDQNSIASQHASQDGIIKAGSWKWKATAEGNEEKRAPRMEKENAGAGNSKKRTKGFCLIDEEEVMENSIHGGKKNEDQRGRDDFYRWFGGGGKPKMGPN